jgi:hypothetical protein
MYFLYAVIRFKQKQSLKMKCFNLIRGRILVGCDPSMNELRATYTHRDLCMHLFRSLTARS